MAEVNATLTLVSRKEAKRRCLTRYFTEKKCRHGHISERYAYNASCIKCGENNTKEWYLKNRDRCKENVYKWRKRNSGRVKSSAKKSSAKWRFKNKERIRENSARRYVKYKDKIKYQVKRWRNANIDRYRKKFKEWRNNNRDAVNSLERNREARKRDSHGSHTAQDIADIFRLQNCRCAYCPAILTKKTMRVDHIIALAKGGDNNRRNLQILCEPCNLAKGARDPIDYVRTLGLLI